MTTPVSVLSALGQRADRVLAHRALAAWAPSMAPHVREEDRRRMLRELERRAGQRAPRTRPRDVATTLQGLGMRLDDGG